MARSWPNTKDQTPYLAIRRCNIRASADNSLNAYLLIFGKGFSGTLKFVDVCEVLHEHETPMPVKFGPAVYDPHFFQGTS